MDRTDERRGDWMQTFTGRAFWPLEPRVEDVRIEDIAHALSRICRFNGHCREFYSVAQHSVLVSRFLFDEPNTDRLCGLLHDAPEAYISDVIRPIKKQIAGYKDIEDEVERVVLERFDLPPIPPCVWRADLVILATEKRDLMAPPPRAWMDLPTPREEIIRPVGPTEAEAMFLSVFDELTQAREKGA